MKTLNALLVVVVVLLFAGLYHIRYAADMQLQDIGRMQSAIDKAQSEKEVLQAEWISLSNPARLEKLSGIYLNMAPVKAGQLHLARTYEFQPVPVVSSVSLEQNLQGSQ